MQLKRQRHIHRSPWGLRAPDHLATAMQMQKRTKILVWPPSASAAAGMAIVLERVASLRSLTPGVGWGCKIMIPLYPLNRQERENIFLESLISV